MKVVQVKCPQCSQPIYMKQKDEFFHCSNCGTIHIRDIHGVERIPYEIAEFRPGVPPQGRHYMPFWRLMCHLQIRSKDVQGGYFHKLASMVRGDGNGGIIWIFVPASELDIGNFRYWSVQLTTNNPHYAVRNDFGNVERIPASINREEAIELADFVAVTLEAEKPGTLQYLDYSLQVQEAKVVYLPFVSTATGRQLAV